MPSLENLKLSVYADKEKEYIQLPESFNLPNLKYLILSKVVGDFHQLATCANLEQITITSCTPDIPEEIGKCSKLTLIYWENDKTPTKPLTSELAKFTKLSKLEIYNNTPFEEKIPKSVQELPRFSSFGERIF